MQNPKSTTLIRGASAPVPGYGGIPGVLATVTTIDLNSAAFQALYTVPAGRTLHVTEVILRDPTHASGANIEGSLGVSPAGTNWAGFPVQSGLTGAGQETHIYPSAIGESASFAAASIFGIILTTLGGTAGKKMTVEVIGYLV